MGHFNHEFLASQPSLCTTIFSIFLLVLCKYFGKGFSHICFAFCEFIVAYFNDTKAVIEITVQAGCKLVNSPS